jgi:hypothetical protein
VDSANSSRRAAVPIEQFSALGVGYYGCLGLIIGGRIAQFQYLRTIDTDAVVQNDVTYVCDYCTTWLEDLAPNQPIRTNGVTFDPLNPEVGYAKLSQAYTAWRELFPLAGAAGA